MSTVPKSNRISPQEYLETERHSETRHEYYRGEMYLMAGGSRNHNTITLNVSGELRHQFKQVPCNVFALDMKVKINATGLYTYPDVVAVCGGPEFESDADELLNPQVIFEVVSKSTAAYDRGEKFQHYRTIPSLTDYLLVSQTRILVEHYTRNDDATWRLRFYNAPENDVTIETLGVTLAVAEIYRKVFFGESEESELERDRLHADDVVQERRPAIISPDGEKGAAHSLLSC